MTLKQKLLELYAKALVVLKALPTYLAIAITILTVFREEIVGFFPPELGAEVTGWIAVAILWLGGVIAAIRKLMPALPGTEGLLTPKGVTLRAEARAEDTLELLAYRGPDDIPADAP